MQAQQSALVICITLGLSLAACGPAKQDDGTHGGAYFPPDKGSVSSFTKELQEASVQCESADLCPGNIGLVVIQDAKFMGQCSGTLVTKDVVLLNSHCIPDDVKASPKNCKESLGFVLASDPSKRAACQELLFASELGTPSTSPDYALMKLAVPLTDSPAVVSTEGFKDSQAVTLYAADPASRTRIEGIVRKKTCVAAQGSLLAPEFTHSYAKVVSLFGKGCNVIGGNSGSGMRNSQDQVIGVVSHGRNRERAAPAGFTLPDELALGANLACIDLSSIGVAPHAQCSEPATAKRDVLAELTDPVKIEAIQRAAVEKLVAGAPKPIKFRFEIRPATPDAGSKQIQKSLLFVTPICVKTVAQWKNQVSTEPGYSRFSGKPVRVVKASHATGDLTILFDIDDKVRVQLKSGRATEAVTSYELELDGDNKQERFRVIEEAEFYGQKLRSDNELQLCSKDQMKTAYELSEN